MKSATSKNRKSYAKGLERREKLMLTAASMLAEQPLDTISLKDIAARAEIPVGSAYHFYANAMDVFAALASRFSQDLNEIITAPYSEETARSWQSLWEEAINRAVQLYQDNPGYRQLIIGGKAPPEIKLADRVNDEDIGEMFKEIMSRHFQFQDFSNSHDVFFFATEIVDLFFSLSVIRHNELTPGVVAEAKKASKAYLRQYLPEEISPITS